MTPKIKPKPAYFSVHALRDGTIVMALLTERPRRHAGERGPITDEDGCHGWFVDKPHDWQSYSIWGKSVVYGAMVNQLNLKRTLRSQVEVRLDRLESSLERIEKLLNDFVARCPAATGAKG